RVRAPLPTQGLPNPGCGVFAARLSLRDTGHDSVPVGSRQLVIAHSAAIMQGRDTLLLDYFRKLGAGAPDFSFLYAFVYRGVSWPTKRRRSGTHSRTTGNIFTCWLACSSAGRCKPNSIPPTWCSKRCWKPTRQPTSFADKVTLRSRPTCGGSW